MSATKSPDGVSEPETAFEAAPVEARQPEPIWTPDAIAAVERAEAELASGGGIPHAEVLRRTREMLGR